MRKTIEDFSNYFNTRERFEDLWEYAPNLEQLNNALLRLLTKVGNHLQTDICIIADILQIAHGVYNKSINVKLLF